MNSLSLKVLKIVFTGIVKVVSLFIPGRLDYDENSEDVDV